MNEELKNILEKSTALFMRYGTNSVSMDDIARELGMSKKTIYKFVENKDDLVMKVIMSHLEGEGCQIMNMRDKSLNAVDELITMGEYRIQELSKMNPSVIYDLMKYHRKVWEALEHFESGYFKEIMMDNIKRGQKEGLYRPELDPNITALLNISAGSVILEQKFFPTPEFSLPIVFAAHIEMVLYGMCTAQGVEVYKERIASKKALKSI